MVVDIYFFNIMIILFVLGGVKALRSASNFEEIYVDPCDNPQSKYIKMQISIFNNKL